MSVIHINFSTRNDYLQLTKTYLCEDSESAYMLWDFMDDYIAEESTATNEKGFYLSPQTSRRSLGLSRRRGRTVE